MRDLFHRSFTVAAPWSVPKQSRARQQAAGNDAALTFSCLTARGGCLTLIELFTARHGPSAAAADKRSRISCPGRLLWGFPNPEPATAPEMQNPATRFSPSARRHRAKGKRRQTCCRPPGPCGHPDREKLWRDIHTQTRIASARPGRTIIPRFKQPGSRHKHPYISRGTARRAPTIRSCHFIMGDS